MHLLNNAGDAFALLHPDGSGVKMSAYFLLPDDIRLDFGPFDNAKVYFEEQDANYIPVPTSDLLIPYLYPEEDLFPERVTPDIYLGMSNLELMDEFGTSLGGVITPSTAVTHPMISGGYVSTFTTSTNDLKHNSNCSSLYPNPTRGLIRLPNDGSADYLVQIISSEGRVLSNLSHSGNAEIDMTEQPNGLYQVRLINRRNNKTCVERVVKVD